MTKYKQKMHTLQFGELGRGDIVLCRLRGTFMHSISLKALLTSNLANVILAVVGVGVTVILALIVEISALGQGHLDDAFRALESSGVFGVVLCLPVVLANVAAGYIAGRIAGGREVLNGAFSSAVIILFGIYLAVFGWDLHTHYHQQLSGAVDLVVSWGGPIWGAVGGYAAQKIAPRLVVRWTLAFPAAVTVYWLLVIVAVGIHSPHLLVGATAAAILVGAGVAPPEHRARAFVTFAILCIVVSVGVTLWRQSLGVASASYAGAIYNAGGAVLAYVIGRRILKQLPANPAA